jgi:hypothetical protein
VGRGRLAMGETIVFEVDVDGEKVTRIVRPEEVLGPSEVPAVGLSFL